MSGADCHERPHQTLQRPDRRQPGRFPGERRADLRHHRAQRVRQDHSVQPAVGLFHAVGRQHRFEGKPITRTPAYERVRLGVGRTFSWCRSSPLSRCGKTSSWPICVSSRRKCHPARFSLRSARHAETLADCAQALAWVGLTEKAPAAVAELSYGDKRMLEIGIVLSLETQAPAVGRAAGRTERPRNRAGGGDDPRHPQPTHGGHHRAQNLQDRRPGGTAERHERRPTDLRRHAG